MNMNMTNLTDVLSSYFCEYDGAPTWLVDLSTSSEHAFPWPLAGECSDRPWGSNYLAEATGAAFQDLYDNVNGMRDHFSRFWKKIAISFKEKKLLGYEIINEPWAGNIYKDPTLLLPGNAGSKNLQPFYDVVQSSIREADPDHIVFYEPVTWGMIFNGTRAGSGFTHVPGGKEHADKSVFSFHYYCWWYTEGQGLEKKTCDDKFGPKVFDESLENARVLGGSAMLTEWGQGCSPSTGMTAECDAVMDMADASLVSWIDWYWTGEVMSWTPSEAAIATYSRTFAQAVAGVPTKMKYDSNTKDFELCYKVNTAIAQPTEIYANFDVHYPDGMSVSVSGSAIDMVVKVDAAVNMIYVQYSGSEDSKSSGMDCCVSISKKV
jgi:endoglycosylceramidase